MKKNDSTKNKKILIADDEPAVLSLLQEILESHGYNCILAENGEETLRLAAEHSPALVITDVFMPVTNGLELLKELLKIKPETEIIAISGYANEATRRKIEAFGAFEFLNKPITPDKLLDTVKRALNSSRIQRLNMQKNESGRILLIDDELTFQEHITPILEAAHYTISRLPNDTNMLERYDKSGYSMVFVNIFGTQKANGTGILRYLKETAPNIPVIAVTDAAAASTASANAFATVPLNVSAESLKQKLALLRHAAGAKKTSNTNVPGKALRTNSDELPPEQINVTWNSYKKTVLIWILTIIGIAAGLGILYFLNK